MTYLGEEGVRARLASFARGLLAPRPTGPRLPRAILAIGHRGSPRFEPENTIASFRRAVEEGADAIEADVCVTRDGEFLLWHDADPDERVALARQVGAERLLYRPEVPPLGDADRRPVRELRADVFLRRHRYRRCLHTAPDGRVPLFEAPVATLRELLAWAPGEERLTDVLLDVKLAPEQTAEAAALATLLKKVEASGALEGLTVRLLSPQAEIVAALRDALPRCAAADALRVSADFELPGAAEQGPNAGVHDVSLGLGRRLWPAFRGDVQRCVRERQRGRFGAVIAWTVNGAERLTQLADIGADGILTDEVGVLRRIAGPRAARRFLLRTKAARPQAGLGRK